MSLSAFFSESSLRREENRIDIVLGLKMPSSASLGNKADGNNWKEVPESRKNTILLWRMLWIY